MTTVFTVVKTSLIYMTNYQNFILLSGSINISSCTNVAQFGPLNKTDVLVLEYDKKTNLTIISYARL